jgi:Cupredoxin-like domain
MLKCRFAALGLLAAGIALFSSALVQTGFAQGIGRLQPKHGGVLFASDAVNAEFVLKPNGGYQVYFTDSTGEELPASIVTDLTLSIKRASGASENLNLHIDDSGESWAGTGSPAPSPITAAISYKFRGKDEQTEIPFANGYRAEFRTIPAQAKAGEPVQLVFTIRDFFGKAVPNLQIEHTKPMHLMVVSRDLSEFDHIHPEPVPGSVFRVPHVFAHGGDYRLYADYTPIGAANRIEAFDVNVAGMPRAQVPLATTTTWNNTLDGLRMVMTTDKPLRTGDDIGFSVTISDAATGAPVHNLQPYLGAWAHIAIISEDTQDFLHVHPAEEPGQFAATYRGGPTPNVIRTQTGFRRAGVYKMWIQVQRGNRVIGVPFIYRVAAGTGAISQGPKIPAGAVLVNVSSAGFEPAHIPAKAGQPLKLAFFRADAQNCAREVVFPDLGIQKDLPPGQTVVVDVTPRKTGSLAFSCGMKMIHGELLVQ